jgi:protein gp37
MADKSKIEWTDASWNPVTGCSRVSDGCKFCYAASLAPRLAAMGQAGYTNLPWTAQNAARNVFTHPDKLGIPLRWKKPRLIFVNSMSDLFHEQVPFEFITRIFGVMKDAKQHTFQVLTKRPERMKEFVLWLRHGLDYQVDYPSPNVWLGVSVEDQRAADERIPLLLQTPAAVRFLSCEPLLGPVDLSNTFAMAKPFRVHWVICGGESGPNARPMRPDWARALRDQCLAASVPFFFKQWGNWIPAGQKSNMSGTLPKSTKYHDFGDSISAHVGKKNAGRFLDGRTWDEYPPVTR